MPKTEPFHNRPRTKIVATVGPACSSEEQLEQLIEAGVDVFRVNTAHGSREEHETVVKAIRMASRKVGRPIGILADLAGPKIRLGTLVQDPTECHVGDEFTIVRGTEAPSAKHLVSNYERLIDELDNGDVVMLADGTVSMEVIKSDPDEVVCKVTGSGIIRTKQGINLPGVKLSIPAMTERDLSNAEWAATNGIDFISLSFVRSPDEVNQLKEIVRSHGSSALVIAKIEKQQAMDRLEEIVAASDGVMVARGDLGVEIDVAETPVAQKRIIDTCNDYAKPVIVATQMLDSMQRNRRPTRAEATDVANAILDGADACMLSGETAIGDFPIESVDMMNRIMLATEKMMEESPEEDDGQPAAKFGVHDITSAVVYGSGRIASRLKAKLVVIVTKSGATARVKAKQRELVPTVGISDSAATLRQMTLLWGIVPLDTPSIHAGPHLREFINQWGCEDGCIEVGDKVVYVTGSDVVAGAHNVLVIYEVE